jgi:uncharacterized protein YndB with AHSA1/START domain
MTELIHRELELPHDLGEVWQALTDPDWLTRWLADEAELELWPGGEARFVVDGEPRHGWVEEITPPSEGADAARLCFWWQDDGRPASRVCLEAERTDGGTTVRVVETRPLEILDLIGMPLGGQGPAGAGGARGPVLVAA